MFRKIIIVFVVLALTSSKLYSQRMAVSTNAVSWLGLSANISAELVLDARFSVDFEASCNPFNKITDQIKLKHISVSPELRYWFKYPMYSHYLSVNMLVSNYDTQIKDSWNMGQLIGVGLGYGYSFIINKRWNLVPNIGLGYGYVRSYELTDRGMRTNIQDQLKPVITRLGVSFSYIIN